MEKHGTAIADKFGSVSNKDKKGSFSSQINHTCFIIAFILLVIAVMPQTNSTHFMIMSLLFAVRAFNGKLKIFRGVLLFIGAFLVGIAATNLMVQMLRPAASAMIFIISVPLLILGFIRTKTVVN
jgi:hypothetical protein